MRPYTVVDCWCMCPQDGLQCMVLVYELRHCMLGGTRPEAPHSAPRGLLPYEFDHWYRRQQQQQQRQQAGGIEPGPHNTLQVGSVGASCTAGGYMGFGCGGAAFAFMNCVQFLERTMCQRCSCNSDADRSAAQNRFTLPCRCKPFVPSLRALLNFVSCTGPSVRRWAGRHDDPSTAHHGHKAAACVFGVPPHRRTCACAVAARPRGGSGAAFARAQQAVRQGPRHMLRAGDE